MRRTFVVIVLAVTLVVAVMPTVAAAYDWWGDLPGCEAAAQSHWLNPSLVTACVLEVMYDIVHGEGWDWT